MDQLKKFTFVIGASLLLAACGGTLDNDSGVIESNSETTETVESTIESQSSESTETQENVDSSSVEESESIVDEESRTELNQDEAAKIERAKEKLTELTGLEEGEEYLYIIDGVEEQIVTINIRENGEEVSSSRGFFKYDDETGNVQELDIITNEYVDFPANQ
ncbi:hypothetical protein [Jeotgalibaca ciconiae]|uniref:Uncharacterized protein n=1 Tax=Jeotgalibaca ciconiae TaxID=2496265 RepID=A0A3Q9BIM1_9LACT|nr:hypothetical protein [Jeotgalibaca ciconiae]AZP03224.1 hypothetical protein EJN90_00275 [Jeotgalibaca ciconiae]HJB24751.1 hypothetical protein [Candidatus Jeotgalibaca pullicola]